MAAGSVTLVLSFSTYIESNCALVPFLSKQIARNSGLGEFRFSRRRNMGWDDLYAFKFCLDVALAFSIDFLF